MKKLYAGIAATALAATGIACTAGAASAAAPWPSPSALRFTPTDNLPTAASTAVSTDGSKVYTVGIDDDSQLHVAVTTIATGDTAETDVALDGSGVTPNSVAIGPAGYFLVAGEGDDGSAIATGQVGDTTIDFQTLDSGAYSVAISANGEVGAIGGLTTLVPVQLATGTLGDPVDLAATSGGDAPSIDLSAVAVTDDGTLAATGFVEAAGADSGGYAVWTVPTSGDSTQTAIQDGPESLAVLANGTLAVGAYSDEDESYAIQYVADDQVSQSVLLPTEPQQLAVSADGTIWASSDSDTSIDRIIGTTVDALDSSNAYPQGYHDVWGVVPDGDTLYAIGDVADEDGDATAASVLALTKPGTVTGDIYAEFDQDGPGTMGVSFGPALNNGGGPVSYAVTVTDAGDSSATVTDYGWTDNAGGNGYVTFPALNRDHAYNISIHTFNGGFSGDTVTGQYLPPLPGNSSVSVTGTPKVGSTLTANVAGWSSSVKLSYQWGVVYSNGQSGGLQDIPHATGRTLTLTSDLAGKKVAVEVSAHQDGYAEGYADSSVIGPIAAAAAQPTTQPTQVTKIKAAPIKSTSKKLKLKLSGVTNAPGKVKVYDGKKLIGKAVVKNGKVVLKLKNHLRQGKHKLKLKYKGSPELAKFTKSVKLKVK